MKCAPIADDLPRIQASFNDTRVQARAEEIYPFWYDFEPQSEGTHATSGIMWKVP
jgi:hypothetical protein